MSKEGKTKKSRTLQAWKRKRLDGDGWRCGAQRRRVRETREEKTKISKAVWRPQERSRFL